MKKSNKVGFETGVKSLCRVLAKPRKKKRNPNDTTFRNINALKKRANQQDVEIEEIKKLLYGLKFRVEDLERAVDKLEGR